MKALARALLVLAALSVLAAAWLWQANFNDGVDIDGPAAATAARLATPAQQARGAYLAQVGNCLACHTARGGAPGAGGLAIATGFGTAFSSNLTPDPDTGIGSWSYAAFERAMQVLTALASFLTSFCPSNTSIVKPYSPQYAWNCFHA